MTSNTKTVNQDYPKRQVDNATCKGIKDVKKGFTVIQHTENIPREKKPNIESPDIHLARQ